MDRGFLNKEKTLYEGRRWHAGSSALWTRQVCARQRPRGPGTLEFLLSQGTENEGESLTKILHGVSMVCSGWLLVPNLGFRGYFNLDGEVIFLTMIMLLTAKY